jgi:hypothetical protein
MTLFGPPEAIEITLRVGVVAGVDHVQLQIECHDAETRELLAMRSVPHRPRTALGPELARALTYVTQLVVALESGTVPPRVDEATD